MDDTEDDTVDNESESSDEPTDSEYDDDSGDGQVRFSLWFCISKTIFEITPCFLFTDVKILSGASILISLPR